jgi:hypothetical protein
MANTDRAFLEKMAVCTQHAGDLLTSAKAVIGPYRLSYRRFGDGDRQTESGIDAIVKRFEEREDLLAILCAFDKSEAAGKPANGPQLKPDHVSTFKLFVDWYYLLKIQPAALNRLAETTAKAA